VTKGLKIQFFRPGPGSRIEVIFEDRTQAEKAGKHTQWATGQYHGARVQGEKWYPVKCDMVAKQAVLDRTSMDDKTLRATVCEDFKKHNVAEGIDFSATKAHWLSKEDYKKKAGSLVIWLKSKFAADHLLKTGTAIFGATGAYCSKWDVKSNEYPCFNCHKQGHRQAECKSVTRCAICSGQHSRYSCPKEKVQCPVCNTAGHTAFDWQCPLHPKNWMYKGKERVMTMRQTGKEQGTTRYARNPRQTDGNQPAAPAQGQPTRAEPDNNSEHKYPRRVDYEGTSNDNGTENGHG
jgi:hypothetical protein